MKPHVLILLENEAFPYDARVRYEAEALVGAGYAVTVAGPTQPGFERLEEEVDGVRALRYRAPPGGGGAAGYLREYTVALWRLRRLVRRVLAEGAVEVVIACNPPDVLPLMARRARRRGTAVVFDHHDLSPELFERKFGRRGPLWRALLALERRAFRAADVVIASNASYAEVARARGGVAGERVAVVRTAPDPRRIHPVEPRPELKRGRSFLVLWQGALTAAERVAALIDAAEELLRRRGRDDVTFALVGPGDAREAVRADVAARGLDGAVDLPGSVPDELLREYLSTADVCVSVDVRNPMNDLSTVTKVLDYMAVGRAVVQFPLAEMSRVCGDAVVYAQEGDPVGLADAIAALLDDPEGRARLGAAARRRMLDGGMWPDQVPALLAAVERARELAAARR